jgi:predicted hydrocarbon binding protein
MLIIIALVGGAMHAMTGPGFLNGVAEVVLTLGAFQAAIDAGTQAHIFNKYLNDKEATCSRSQ